MNNQFFESSQLRHTASDVGEIILADGYHDQSSPGVQDVLLYGSTITRGHARDIDLLLIHRHRPLDTYGVVTRYDERSLKMVPDPHGDITNAHYSARSILGDVGGRSIPSQSSLNEVEEFLWQELESERDSYRAGFSGVLQPPVTRPFVFNSPTPIDEVLRQVRQEVGLFEKQLVVYRVSRLIEEMGLDVDQLLDLHTMNAGILNPNEMQNERGIAIQQCNDPTYWHEVLTTGKLYNRATHDFDTPVDAKYPGGPELFRVS